MGDRALQNIQDIIRLPVYDLDNYNQDAARTSAEQQFINCYPIITSNVLTGEKAASLYKRPGHSLALTLSPTINTSMGSPAPGNVTCLANFAMTQVPDVFVCAMYDATAIRIVQYRPAAGTSLLIGSISTSTGHLNDQIFFTEITQGDSLVPGIFITYKSFDNSTSTGYYALTTTGAFTAASLTTVSSGSFPPNLGTPKILTGKAIFLNGILYVYTLDGFIYGSGTTAAGNPDVTSWNTLTSVTTSQYPDTGVGMERFKNYIMAFGADSVEFFSDVGNPPPKAAISKTDQAFIKFGAISPKCIINIDDQIYWLGYGTSDTCGLWSLNGLQPTKLTTEKQDIKINQFISSNQSGAATVMSLECLLLNGKKHLILNGLGSAVFTGVAQQTAPITISSASDTFPLTAGNNENFANILAYSIQDSVFWGLELCNNTSIAGIIPSTTFPTANTTNQYVQYCFRRGGTVNLNTECSPDLAIAFDKTYSTGNYFDVNPGSAVRTVEPVTMSWNHNVIWFGNEKRKRINKIKIIADPVTISDGNTYSVYFAYGRDSTTGAQRRVTMPQPHFRCYVSNCGAGRQINLSFTFKSKCDWHVLGVEIEVDQGNH